MPELEFGVRKQGEFGLLVLDARVRSLEIEARADLLAGLVDGIAHFDHVGFGDDVEGGHDGDDR